MSIPFPSTLLPATTSFFLTCCVCYCIRWLAPRLVRTSYRKWSRYDVYGRLLVSQKCFGQDECELIEGANIPRMFSFPSSPWRLEYSSIQHPQSWKEIGCTWDFVTRQQLPLTLSYWTLVPNTSRTLELCCSTQTHPFTFVPFPPSQPTQQQ